MEIGKKHYLGNFFCLLKQAFLKIRWDLRWQSPNADASFNGWLCDLTVAIVSCVMRQFIAIMLFCIIVLYYCVSFAVLIKGLLIYIIFSCYYICQNEKYPHKQPFQLTNCLSHHNCSILSAFTIADVSSGKLKNILGYAKHL